MKKRFNIFLVGILIITLSAFISADFGLGFASGITVSPGKTVVNSFSIQNVIEPTSDITVKITVEEGSEYISFTQGTTFEIAAGEIVSVPVSFTVPKGANIGDIYPAKILFETASGGVDQGGTVQFSTGISKSFDIVVVEESQESATPQTPGKNGNNSLLWALAILIIVIVITIIIKRKR